MSEMEQNYTRLIIQLRQELEREHTAHREQV
jgi:hypothetical protein